MGLEHRHRGKKCGDFVRAKIWFSYFKKANDTRPKLFGELYGRGGKAYDELRSYFFICDWFEVYDFVEFIVISVTSINDIGIYHRFSEYCSYRRKYPLLELSINNLQI